MKTSRFIHIITLVCLLIGSISVNATNVTLKVIDKTKGSYNNGSVYAWIGQYDFSWEAIGNISNVNSWYADFSNNNTGSKITKTSDEWIWEFTFNATAGNYSWNPYMGDPNGTNIEICKTLNITSKNIDFLIDNNGSLSGETSVVIYSSSAGAKGDIAFGNNNIAGSIDSNAPTDLNATVFGTSSNSFSLNLYASDDNSVYYTIRYRRIDETNIIPYYSALHVTGTSIYNAGNKEIKLRGTNLGSWLVQEDWMTGDICGDQRSTINTLYNRFGAQKAEELIDLWEENWITEKDLDNIKNLGMNLVRVPFTWMNLMDMNTREWKPDAWERLDWILKECSKRDLWVILCMHGAPGAQNGRDHSGVSGGSDEQAASEFWFGANAPANQTLYYEIWETIAARYKNNATIAGFDLLNEPFCQYRYTSTLGGDVLHSILYSVYNNTYKKIRKIDPNRILIMEAVWDPWDLPNPSSYSWSNVIYEYHNYEYSDYDNYEGKQITSMTNKINSINGAKNAYNLQSYMGEFCYFNTTATWETGMALLNNNDIHWTSWSYKVQAYYGNWGLYNCTKRNINLSNASELEIRDAWSNSTVTKNTNIADIISYYASNGIDKSPTSGIYYNTWTENPSGYTASTIITGLKPNATYEYIVNAYDKYGNMTSDLKATVKTLNTEEQDIYDYWVIYRDNVSDMSNYLDLRSNSFADWAGTTSQIEADKYESENAMAYIVNSAKGSWFGFGIINISGTYNFEELSNYKLHFAYKTNYNGPLYVKLGGTNGEYSVEFTPNSDNKWHTQEISMSSFTDAGMILGESTENLIFSIVSENVTTSGAIINLDDIYYCKNQALPIVLTNADNTKNSIINIYQPTPNEICITGIDIDTEIELTNLSGLCVLKTSSNDYEARIPTNNLPKSVYIIRIGDTVGKILLK